MAEDMLARLKGIDLAILTDVVREDQHNPSFEITEWSIKRLSGKGIANPNGLWLVSGRGQSGDIPQTWSLVVKIINRPSQEASPDARGYWKRELLVAQSGLLERMSESVRVPHFYRMDESNDSIWMWMEHVKDESDSTWTLDDFAFAARLLGRWHGTCLTTPLPADAWLNKQMYRAWLIDPENDFQSPLHQKYISADTRHRFEQLWADRDLFYRVLESLPQCFSHLDCNRRNLLIRRGADDQDDLVIIDWALCGVGALGAELHALVGGSASFLEWPPSALATLDEAVFNSYIQGLRETGWSGDPDLVRLGYVGWIAIYRGVIFPMVMNYFCAPEKRAFTLQAFDLAEEDLYVQWLPILYYFLDRADEARHLMRKLKFL